MMQAQSGLLNQFWDVGNSKYYGMESESNQRLNEDMYYKLHGNCGKEEAYYNYNKEQEVRLLKYKHDERSKIMNKSSNMLDHMREYDGAKPHI